MHKEMKVSAKGSGGEDLDLETCKAEAKKEGKEEEWKKASYRD